MSALLGERDRLIMNTVPRYSTPLDRALMLTASATMFEVSLAGVPTPASITFSALMLGAVGAITFSSEPAVPLTVANGNAVLSYADMGASIVTVTATTVIEGVTYLARQTVAKQQALDLTPPPAPTGLVATGHPATITLAWDAAPANYKNLSHTEVWRAPVNNFAQAVLVGRADGREYTDPVGPGVFRYYWIRYVSRAAIPGPYNASSGTVGASDAEVEHLLEVLTGEITESQLYADLGAKIDLIEPLVGKVVDLEEVYGDTESAATSAASAAAAAAAALLAQQKADSAAGLGGEYAEQSLHSATAAATAASTAGTYRDESSQASNSATGSAAAAQASAGTAAQAAFGANNSAGAAAGSSQTAASYATEAETAATSSMESKISAEAARSGAASAANAASGSAASAAVKATEAGESASAASRSATTATTKAAEAGAYATQAAAAETTATGSASESAASAGVAADAAFGANSAASAASGWASSAAAEANASREHAVAANASATTANTKAAEAGAYAAQAAESTTTAAGSASRSEASAGVAADAAFGANSAVNAASGWASSAAAEADASREHAVAANSAATTATTRAADAGVFADNAAESETRADGSARAAANFFQQAQATLNDPITGLVTGVAAVKASGEATADSVAGLQAKYSIKMDVGGVVGGLELLGGGGAIDFAVRGSIFSIAAPEGSGIASAVPFIVRTTETVIDGVTIPIGVYIANAFIQNASITNAKIGGDIWSSNYSPGQAGWYLNRAGDFYANSVRLRGAITGGAFTEFAWPNGAGFYLGPEGLRLGDIGSGKYFHVSADGQIYAPGFSIVNGNATFSGTLAAAGGSFTGNLAAASGTLGTITAGYLQNATNTTYVNLNAVGGQTFLYAGGGKIRLNADGSGAFARVIISEPNVVKFGKKSISVGWRDNTMPFTEYVDTGEPFSDLWYEAPSATYIGNATLSGGLSESGGLSGYVETTVVVGGGLYSGAQTPVGQRIYLRVTWTPGNGSGRVNPASIAWKLVKV